MYLKIKQLYGLKLNAIDGPIGRVRDFYFDDHAWRIRYLVVDPGTWLPNRQLLFSSHAFSAAGFGRSETKPDLLLVDLTKEQVQSSPPLEAHRHVLRQDEEAYFRHYHWNAYWELGTLALLSPHSSSSPVFASPHQRAAVPSRVEQAPLRSTKNVSGYQVQGSDGLIGFITDFTVDPRTWTIKEILVETGHWYSRKEVLILPENVQFLNHEESTLFVALSRQDITHTMDADVAQIYVDPAGIP